MKSTDMKKNLQDFYVRKAKTSEGLGRMHTQLLHWLSWAVGGL